MKNIINCIMILLAALACLPVRQSLAATSAENPETGVKMEQAKMGPFERGDVNPYGKYFEGVN